MKTLGNLSDAGTNVEPAASKNERSSTALVAVVSCLLLAAVLTAGYFLLFRGTAEPPVPSRQQSEQPMAASTEAQIFEDEALIKGSQAVIGGTVRNISREPLSGLTLELELKRRADGSTETRTVAVQPDTLAPGSEGKYTLTLPRQEFSATQIKRLRSSARPTQIVFKTAQGARRPRELPPEPPTRTVIVQRPTPRSSGEEFINTPDTPTRVP